MRACVVIYGWHLYPRDVFVSVHESRRLGLPENRLERECCFRMYSWSGYQVSNSWKNVFILTNEITIKPTSNHWDKTAATQQICPITCSLAAWMPATTAIVLHLWFEPHSAIDYETHSIRTNISHYNYRDTKFVSSLICANVCVHVYPMIAIVPAIFAQSTYWTHARRTLSVTNVVVDVVAAATVPARSLFLTWASATSTGRI